MFGDQIYGVAAGSERETKGVRSPLPLETWERSLLVCLLILVFEEALIRYVAGSLEALKEVEEMGKFGAMGRSLLWSEAILKAQMLGFRRTKAHESLSFEKLPNSQRLRFWET
jgi:hypothetical protein